MHIRELKLTQFKNHGQETFSFCPGLNGISGLNGVGKTNILEAIYLLCLGRNPRHLLDRQMIQHGGDFYRVEGRFERAAQTEKMVVKYKAGQRKVLERNDEVLASLSSHIGRYPVVMIAPDDSALVQEGSEERRRFMDVALSQMYPEYLEALSKYQQVLKQRNALLKRFDEERFFDAQLLESISVQLPAPADVIHQNRKLFIDALNPVFEHIYASLSNQRERASVTYQSDLDQTGMEQLLARRIEKDRVLTRTSAGIHRDELEFALDEMPVKKFGSQGQLKSFLLALRLAQYEYLRTQTGTAPILLLDDVFDKLDATRVQRLVELLVGRAYGQVFLTDTHPERLEQVLRVAEQQLLIEL